MYEDPWYWVVLEKKARKYLPGERKPCIVLDSTPVAKVQIETKSTWAPVKSLVQQKSVTKLVAVKLDSEFAATQASIEEEEYDIEEEKQMDEIEEAIKKDDKYLVSIDSRYIRALEEENAAYRRRQTYKEEATYYYDQYMITNELYKNETIKTKSLMEAFQIMTKEKQT
jgi:Skp family chaperone for outer membrane proteins